MKNIGTKLLAVFAVAIMLSVMFVCVIDYETTSAIKEEGTTEPLYYGDYESKTLVLEGFWLVVALIAATAVGATGGIAGFLFFGDGVNNSPDPSPQNRANELQNFSNILQTGTAWNTNSINQIKEVWQLTNDHWIRQCELVSGQIWMKGAGFSDFRTWILDRSGTYYNSAVLIQNAFEQLNESYKGINTRLEEWKDDKYNGTYENIQLGFTVNNTDGLIMESKDYWNAHILSCAKADGDKNMVYISGGEITPFVNDEIAGSDTQIQRVFLNNDRQMEYGPVITIKGNQTTNLDSITDFKPGVYALPKNVTYAGNITPTYDGHRDATVYPAYVLTAGKDSERKVGLVYYDVVNKITDQHVIWKGESYDSIELSAYTDKTRTVISDFTQPLKDMQSLLETTKTTIASALSSANAVWNIYEKAGEPSIYVSTLLFADVDSYDNVQLNSVTREILTILAMEQLKGYWEKNEEKLMAGTYTMSTSMSVYMLGSIKVGDGETEYYKNVIFTPFINEYNQKFVEGQNKINQYTQVAIWKTVPEGTTSINWDERPGEVELAETSLINLGPSVSEIYITDILYFKEDGTPEHPNYFDMEVKEMQHIDPEKLPTTPLKPVVTEGNNIAIVVMIIMAILGLIGVIYGLKNQNYIILAVGVVVIVAGFFVSGPIAEFIGRFT